LCWHPIVNRKYTPQVEIANFRDSKRGFQTHRNEIIKVYGDNVPAFNLVDKKQFEMMLSREFELLCIERNNSRIKYVPFDFNKEHGKMQYDRISVLYDKIGQDMKFNSWFTCNPEKQLNPNEKWSCADKSH
jgi:SacI homology domain